MNEVFVYRDAIWKRPISSKCLSAPPERAAACGIDSWLPERLGWGRYRPSFTGILGAVNGGFLRAASLNPTFGKVPRLPQSRDRKCAGNATNMLSGFNAKTLGSLIEVVGARLTKIRVYLPPSPWTAKRFRH
jgi:hypothetical protein